MRPVGKAGMLCAVIMTVGACASSHSGAGPGNTKAQPQPLSTAVLGGSRQAWIARLGPPISDPTGTGSIETFGQQCPGRPDGPDAFAFQIEFHDDRATSVLFSPCPLAHVIATLSDVQLYLPSDSKLQGSVTHRLPVPITDGGTDDYALTSGVLASSMSKGLAAACDSHQLPRADVQVIIDINGWSAQSCRSTG